ncbi:MAG TPA: NAD(+)--dinitrogen-reductase ADP-D-ribosyltransferase, partial [Syntrophorhabdaceae bacterium]|nr:NAD(+)--dinitrogen-reductase ADP-D-ribosyltransferase [Syntrophorhabdaceae bacterium]
AAKPFEKVPAEVKTLLDPTINPQSAKIFGELFKTDVFMEAEGAKPLLSLKKTVLSKVFADAGLSAGEAKELTETLWHRREFLVDRYNLKGTYSPTGFGKYFEDFKKWGTSSWTPKVVNNMINGSTDTAFQIEMTSLVKRFEEYINSKIHRYSRGVARALFREWSHSSSNEGAATIKLWAEERFGYITRYHSGSTNRETIRSTLENHVRLSLSRARLDVKTVYKILDAEYEFHQYYLRRLHGYDEFKALRYVSNSEFNGSFENNLWQGNAVQSVTVKRGGFSGSRQVELEHRVENVIKTYYQGEKYMHYGAGESEYIVLGKKVPAKVIR